MRLAKVEYAKAKELWDEYQEDYEKYAKIAKSITVVRSDRYNSTKTAFKEAAAKYEQLKAEFDALGIQSGDTPEDLECEIEKTNSRIEAHNIRNTLFKQIK